MNNRCGIVQELRYVLIIIRSLIGKMRFESRGWNMVQMLRRPGVLSGQQICKNSHVCHVQIIRSFFVSPEESMDRGKTSQKGSHATSSPSCRWHPAMADIAPPGFLILISQGPFVSVFGV